MTVKQARKMSVEQLGIVYPEGEAAAMVELLFEKITGIERKHRSSIVDAELDEAQEQLLHDYLRRLKTHEPIQYVLQEAWFCGLSFYVDRRVLIPRPETEELVEWIIAGCRFPVRELSILDVGTGSGCIPVSLKRRIRKADVWACDVSRDALDVARQNATAIGVDIRLLEVNFLDQHSWNQLPSVDIIVSNPPYIPNADRAGMHANVLNYEPALALFVDDKDPLIFYRRLAEFGKTNLQPGGSVYMEMHEELADATAELFIQQGYSIEIKHDMQGKKRMLRAWIV